MQISLLHTVTTYTLKHFEEPGLNTTNSLHHQLFGAPLLITLFY